MFRFCSAPPPTTSSTATPPPRPSPPVGPPAPCILRGWQGRLAMPQPHSPAWSRPPMFSLLRFLWRCPECSASVRLRRRRPHQLQPHRHALPRRWVPPPPASSGAGRGVLPCPSPTARPGRSHPFFSLLRFLWRCPECSASCSAPPPMTSSTATPPPRPSLPVSPPRLHAPGLAEVLHLGFQGYTM